LDQPLNIDQEKQQKKHKKREEKSKKYNNSKLGKGVALRTALVLTVECRSGVQN